MLPKPSMVFSARAQVEPPTRQVDRESRARVPGIREMSHSGELITPEVSLTVPAVLAAFSILCEDIASLPLVLYERGRNGERLRASANPYYSLLHDTPNPEHTSFQFREMMIGHLLAWGNFFAQIITDQRGNVAELWPLRPDRMTVLRMNGEKSYLYQSNDGPKAFLRDEILHVPAFGFDGLVGYSRIALARNSIGLAMSAEKFGSKFFANDARPGIVLEHPGELGDTAYKNIKASWLDNHQGASKAHLPDILEEGMKVHEIGFPPEDIQFIETQKFTVVQIARIFRVPPHMIGDVERSTSWGTGIDSQEQGYINHTLRPWTIRTEQALGQQLLLPAERKIYYWEHLFDALVRGDIATRYEAYVKAINNGFMSPNEVRGKENLLPYKGGDVYVLPLNTGPANQPQANSARPLFMDTASRVLRRESSELRDAAQRWLAKGRPERYAAWVEQFYRRDFPTLAVGVFQPLAESGLLTIEQVQDWVNRYCESRGALALDGSDLPDYSPAQFVDGLLEYRR